MRSLEKSLARPGAGDVIPLWSSALSDGCQSVVGYDALSAARNGSRGEQVRRWRQWKHQTVLVRSLFHKVRATRRAQADHVEAYLARCLKLVARAEADLPDLLAHGASPWKIVEIENLIGHARRQIDQVERRLVKGETIAHDEKVFSIFARAGSRRARQGVRWSWGGGRSASWKGFILHHEVMWDGSDVDYAVPMVAASQARFPDLRAASFDRGFHSPDNRIRLDALLDHNVLPKKGYLNAAERERAQSAEFVAMRRQHPAVESAINNLEQRGLDRVVACGADGFARVVALSVVALNIHRIGLLQRRKKRRRRAA